MCDDNGFGSPDSDRSAFVETRRHQLASALRSPRLMPGQQYSLRTRPLCSGGGCEQRYLCVGCPVPCQPEILPVQITECDGSLLYTLYWSNSRGAFVDLYGCQEAIHPGVALRAARGRLTCAVMEPCSEAAGSCCSGRRRCLWHAT